MAFILICLAAGSFGRAEVLHSSTYFVSDKKRIVIEEFSSNSPRKIHPPILMLSGSGGLKSPNLPYGHEARWLAERGYRVYLLHYLDATRGSASNPAAHYSTWVRVAHDAIASTLTKTEAGVRRVVLIGFSLGASVALAEASRDDARVAGVVAWSGSLPDEYARIAVTLPPILIIHGEKDTVIPVADAAQLTKLCELLKTRCEFQVFRGESHWFSAGAISTANQFIWTFLESLS